RLDLADREDRRQGRARLLADVRRRARHHRGADRVSRRPPGRGGAGASDCLITRSLIVRAASARCRPFFRRRRAVCRGETDMDELIAIAGQIAQRLVARKETIAVAESSAGGLIAASLLAVPGATAYFLGGAVVYPRDARRVLMDIPDEAMRGIRSASEPYAEL